MPPGTMPVKAISQYVSMRVHGTSAHINRGAPPDVSTKVLTAERHGRGTRVSANTQFLISAHFAIPTPLQLEDLYIPISVGGGPVHPDTPVHKVFAGSSIWVVQVGIEVTNHNHLDVLELWDGKRLIFQKGVQEAFGLAPDGTYSEDRPPSGGDGTWIFFDLNRRIYSALGLTLTARMFETSPDQNFFELHAVKAIFNIQ